jgi:hypothetical protein
VIAVPAKGGIQKCRAVADSLSRHRRFAKVRRSSPSVEQYTNQICRPTSFVEMPKCPVKTRRRSTIHFLIETKISQPTTDHRSPTSVFKRRLFLFLKHQFQHECPPLDTDTAHPSFLASGGDGGVVRGSDNTPGTCGTLVLVVVVVSEANQEDKNVPGSPSAGPFVEEKRGIASVAESQASADLPVRSGSH